LGGGSIKQVKEWEKIRITRNTRGICELDRKEEG